MAPLPRRSDGLKWCHVYVRWLLLGRFLPSRWVRIGPTLTRSFRLIVRNTPGSFRRLLLPQRVLDPLLQDVVVAGDALDVDGLEDRDAVPGPFGDLSCRDAAVEPGRQARVPQVVDPL